MERITKSMIESKVNHLAELTGLATSKESAIEKGKDKYLAIDYASNYGGYRLVNVGVSNGAHYGAFNQGSTATRMKANQFYTMLSVLIDFQYWLSKNF